MSNNLQARTWLAEGRSDGGLAEAEKSLLSSEIPSSSSKKRKDFEGKEEREDDLHNIGKQDQHRSEMNS